MMGESETMNGITEEQAERLLRQLIHLKGYETPDPARMVRSKQNIMRSVRNASANKRKSLGDLLEINIPWFFAEPKYGIAALFVAFAGLQYVGINTRNAANSQTGIYTTDGTLASYAQVSATNTISYPKLPDNLRLFPDGYGGGDIKFVEHIQR